MHELLSCLAQLDCLLLIICTKSLANMKEVDSSIAASKSKRLRGLQKPSRTPLLQLIKLTGLVNLSRGRRRRATLRVFIQELHDQTPQVMFRQLDRSSTAEHILLGKAPIELLDRVCKKALLMPRGSGLILLGIEFPFRFDASQKETLLYNAFEGSLQLHEVLDKRDGLHFEKSVF